MKTYLLDSFNRYKRYSEKLDAKTVLCNKCWWVFNDVGEKETYIFKEDGTIIISRLGAVTYGKWEYIPVNKSIIISGNSQSYMVLPSFVDEYILALQVDGTNNFAFLIDEQSKAKFTPKSYQDVIGYFEEKERVAIEAKKKEEQRLLEAQRQREIEVEKEQQKKLDIENKSRAKDLFEKWDILLLNGEFNWHLIPRLLLGICLCQLIMIPLILLLGSIFAGGPTLSMYFRIYKDYPLIPIAINVPAIIVLIARKPFKKWKIRRYIEQHPNDPVNPFLKEHL